MSTTFSIGQMNQLADALDRAGFNPDDITKLRGFDGLKDLRLVLCGQAEIVLRKHVIELDADLFVPEGWTVEEHRKGGKFEWSPTRVTLYLDEEQKSGEGIEGNKLREKLKDKPVLNANVLDYLLRHPKLIPEEWKDKAIFFWGTIYRVSEVNISVCYLYWRDNRWRWGFSWLDCDWNDDDLALLLQV